MIDFQDFKREYINENLPKLYAGELDVDMAQIVWNMNSEECCEFNNAARDMYVSSQWRKMDALIEKLAIEHLSSEAKTEYKNMIAAVEDEAGADSAFYNMNR